MKRLPPARLYRGLLRAKLMEKSDLKTFEDRLKDPAVYRQVNEFYTSHKGHKWIGKVKMFADWLWKYREEILQILGFVIMFAEDGRPMLRDKAEVEAEELARVKKEKALAKRKEKAAKERAEKEAEEARSYDIGIVEDGE